MTEATATTGPRKRFTKEQRLAQLLDVAWQLVASEGTDALSLGRLAEAAGITKPTVYDHFGTRQGLLAALYRDFDARQNQIIDAAIAASGPTLQQRAEVIASSYIGCCLAEGREIPGVLAALQGSPELAQLKRQCQLGFLDNCQAALAPWVATPSLPKASLWAMLGAADALSQAAMVGDITPSQAQDELRDMVVLLAQRGKS